MKGVWVVVAVRVGLEAGGVVLLGVVLAVRAEAESEECLSGVLCYGSAVIHTVSPLCYSK